MKQTWYSSQFSCIKCVIFLDISWKMLIFGVHVNTFSAFFFFFFFFVVLCSSFWGLVELLSSSPIPCFHVGFKSIYCFGWRKPKKKKKKKADMKIHLYSLLMEAVNVWCRWDLKHTERLMPRCSRGEIKTAHLKNLHILQIYRNRGVKEPRETGFFCFFFTDAETESWAGRCAYSTLLLLCAWRWSLAWSYVCRVPV